MTSAKQRSLTMSIAGAIASAGLAIMDRGVYLAWHPGGWILGGLFITVPSVFVAYAAFREK
jgi:hypothetical protein